MNDPFVTFDTLSIGAESGDTGSSTPSQPAEKPLDLLARLPRIAPARPKRVDRFDDAEPTIPIAHLAEATDRLDDLPDASTDAAQPDDLGDPIATIRFDTVSVGAPEPQPTAAAPEPAARPSASPSAPPPIALEPDEEWSSWLLNLEGSIQPYSRWIALAAVIAALGLTIVLLRGGGPGLPAHDSAPAVNTDLTGQSLVDVDADAAEAPYWPGAPQAESPIEEAVAAAAPARPQASAAGPASAPRGGQATLTGEVLPAPPERVNVAAESFPPDATMTSTDRAFIAAFQQSDLATPADAAQPIAAPHFRAGSQGGKAPLAEHLARREAANAPNVGEPTPLRPGVEVDRFAWPEMVDSLAAEARPQLLELLSVTTAGGRSAETPTIVLLGAQRRSGVTTTVLAIARLVANVGGRVAILDATGPGGPASMLGVRRSAQAIEATVPSMIDDLLVCCQRTKVSLLAAGRGASSRLITMAVSRLGETHDLLLVDAGHAADSPEWVAATPSQASVLLLEEVGADAASRNLGLARLAKLGVRPCGMVETLTPIV